MSTEAGKRTMILVSVSIDPKRVQSFLEAFYECVEKCKKEPECERFEVFNVPSEDGVFRWVETWKGDQEWFSNVSKSSKTSLLIEEGIEKIPNSAPPRPVLQNTWHDGHL